ncbi:ATP-binding cassette-type vacuolar membrane transporter Hmt1, partial [Coemansia nantahalensis]
ATSALDTNTERHIQASLREMTQDRTTLIIAHRLSTVIHADLILIVQNGEIVERGTHADLIADLRSVYYDMWMKQLTDAANASYNPFLDSASIPASLPMPGAMTPENPQAMGASSSMPPPPPPPPLLPTIPHPGECSEGESAGSAGRPARDILRLALDEPQLHRWCPEGPLTVPLVSTISGANLFSVKTTSPAGTTASSLSIEAGRGGIATNLVDSATGQLSDLHAESCGMSYEPFNAGELLSLQQRLQEQQHGRDDKQHERRHLD